MPEGGDDDAVLDGDGEAHAGDHAATGAGRGDDRLARLPVDRAELLERRVCDRDQLVRQVHLGLHTIEGLTVNSSARHSKIRRCIIDKGVKIPAGTQIGYDIEADKQHFTVTDTGIVVVPKGALIEEKVMV